MAKDRLGRLGAAIKQRRADVRVSQETLGFDAGISLRHIQRIEAGLVDMRLSTLDTIAEAMGTTSSRLLDAADAAGGRKSKK